MMFAGERVLRQPGSIATDSGYMHTNMWTNIRKVVKKKKTNIYTQKLYYKSIFLNMYISYK